MKFIKVYGILLLIAVVFSNTVTAQTHGFVQVDKIQVSGITNDQGIATLVLSQKQTSRAYFDGLGRTVQTVNIQASPGQDDIIQPVVYDNLGRQRVNYLPYAGSASDVTGSYRISAVSAQSSYYANGTADKVADDSAPYNQQVFETSPLQRLLSSGMVGNGFQPGVSGNHYKTVSYRANTSADGNIVMWGPDGSNMGYYATGSLSVTDGRDEDYTETLTFTDLAGHLVLKRQVFSITVNYDTYYVYNNAGAISYIIPPSASALIIANSYALTQASVSSLLFQFWYDSMGRVYQKKVPSKGLMAIIYDPLNRPVLIQDNNLAAQHQWNYIKYDAKGRAISQGIYTDTGHDNTNMQAYVNGLAGYSAYTYESRSNASATGYYTNNVFPNTTANMQPLGYAYYDDYDLNQDGSHVDDYHYSNRGLINEGLQTTAPMRDVPTMVRTHAVGSGLNIWLLKVMFYDKNGHLLQVQTNNQLNYTAETITDYKTSTVDFTGTPTQTLAEKVTGTGAINNQSVKTTLTYDQGYRLKTVDQSYNGAATVHIGSYAYNELGQLVDKSLGSTNGTTWLQSVDYRYNIRSQLTSINNSKLTNDGTLNNDSNDLFGMQIYYDQMDGNLSDWAYYNGKIAAIKWMSKNADGTTTNERAFTYTYDNINRYMSAGYEERAAASTSAFTITHGWDETITGYDSNGNIKGLTRNATTQGSGTYTQVDNLTYTYSNTNANQLVSVTDGTGTNYTGTGFRNLTGSTGSYGYDSNGNQNSDPYKGLSFSAYNVLNRVDKITCTAYTGRYIDYTYDASGNLIRKRQYDNNALVHTTDYIDGFVYLDNTISYYNMPEGRVMNIGGTMKPEYIITDQQGNARVSFMDNGSGTAVVQQENSYYGFGMVMPGSLITGDNNKNLYNGGSEWQNDYNNLPDYYQTFYRNYDAALARWIGTDPMAEVTEGMSVYQYSSNNPIMYNDPLGDVSDAQWLMVLVSYNNGPIESSYHADSGNSYVTPLDDGSAFQAGAAYAANTGMFGSSSILGMAGSYSAAVSRYNSSRAPGETQITTGSPVASITTWRDENYIDADGFLVVNSFRHTIDLSADGYNANQGRVIPATAFITGFYDSQRVGKGYTGNVTGLGFLATITTSDGGEREYNVSINEASFQIKNYKGDSKGTVSAVFQLAYNEALNLMDRTLRGGYVPNNEFALKREFTTLLNLLLNIDRPGSSFNSGGFSLNISVPPTPAQFLQ